MSPRTGRPTENPKNNKITVRLDDESTKIMTKYCEQEKIEKAEAVRVLTTKQIAVAYGADEKHVKQNHANNRARFIEGKHYIS